MIEDTVKTWWQNSNKTMIILVFATICLVPGIWNVSLFDRDEPRFAEAARQMIERDDYIVPYFNGEPRLHKPPLIYWVMVGAYKLFGVDEFGARIGSALAGILTCLLVYVIARDMFGPSVAMLSGIIMASNVLMLLIGHAATADSVQLLTLMICFLGFWKVHKGERRLVWYLVLYAGVALGGLAKGPVVVSVFLFTVIAIAAQERTVGAFRGLKLLPGLLAAVVIVLLWLIPADLATEGGFIREGLGHHVLDRAFKQSMEGHSGPFFYYIVLLPFTFAPWFMILPLAVRRFWKARDIGTARAFLLAWAVAPFILFSFLRTKLPHYVLPAFPALAIITAFGLDAMIREKESIREHWLGKAGIGITVFAGVLSIVGLVGFAFYAEIDALKKSCLGPAMLLVVALGLSINDIRHRRNHLLTVNLAVGMALLAVVIGTVYLPDMDRQCAARKLRYRLRRVVKNTDEIVSVGYREPSLVFYSRRPVHFTSRWKTVAQHLSESEDLVLVVRGTKIESIPPELEQTLRTITTTSAFMPSKGKWDSFTIMVPKSRELSYLEKKRP